MRGRAARPRGVHHRARAARRGGREAILGSAARTLPRASPRSRRSTASAPPCRTRSRTAARPRRVPPGAARAAAGRAAVVVQGLRQPPRAPAAVARDRIGARRRSPDARAAPLSAPRPSAPPVEDGAELAAASCTPDGPSAAASPPGLASRWPTPARRWSAPPEMLVELEGGLGPAADAESLSDPRRQRRAPARRLDPHPPRDARCCCPTRPSARGCGGARRPRRPPRRRRAGRTRRPRRRPQARRQGRPSDRRRAAKRRRSTQRPSAPAAPPGEDRRAPGLEPEVPLGVDLHHVDLSLLQLAGVVRTHPLQRVNWSSTQTPDWREPLPDLPLR